MEKEIKSLSGETFKFRIEERAYISVLEAGYAITPDGEFIPVKDSEDHRDIYSVYLDHYLGDENRYLVNEILEIPKDVNVKLSLESMEAMTVLTKLNHIVYFGVKISDVKTILNNGNNDGFGVLILPDNYESSLTEEQKQSLLDLLATNRSIFGGGKKIEVQIHQIKNDLKITDDELVEKLSSRGR